MSFMCFFSFRPPSKHFPSFRTTLIVFIIVLTLQNVQGFNLGDLGFCDTPEVPKCECPSDVSNAYLTRFINLLLISTKLKGQSKHYKDEESIVVTMDLQLSGRDIRLLNDYGLGKTKLGQIDHVIASMFKESSLVNSYWVREFSNRIALALAQVISSKQFLFAVVILYIMWMTVNLVNKHSYAKAIAYVFVGVFVLAVALKWEGKRQEKVIENDVLLMKHKELPRDCRMWEHSGLEAIKNFFTPNPVNCEMYYKAAGLDPILTIPLMEVVTETLAEFYIGPLKNFSHLMLDLVEKSTADFNFFLRGPLKFLASILILVSIIYYSLTSFFVAVSNVFRRSIVLHREVHREEINRVEELPIENKKTTGTAKTPKGGAEEEITTEVLKALTEEKSQSENKTDMATTSGTQ